MYLKIYFLLLLAIWNLEISQSRVFLSFFPERENVSSPKLNKVLIMRLEPHDNNTYEIEARASWTSIIMIEARASIALESKKISYLILMRLEPHDNNT